MYIGKMKIFTVLLVIIITLFKTQYMNIITKDTNKFALRRVITHNQELPSFPEDYDSVDYAEKYLENFLSKIQNDVNLDVSQYIEKDYYDEKISKNKDKFIQEMKDNVVMNNPLGNHHDIDLITKYINKDGLNTYAFNVLVLEKGLDYPAGYNSLIERNDKDKKKNIDIHVIEYSPYNFKIIFPDKTVYTGEH